jgi:hypothetical protein
MAGAGDGTTGTGNRRKSTADLPHISRDSSGWHLPIFAIPHEISKIRMVLFAPMVV